MEPTPKRLLLGVFVPTAPRPYIDIVERACALDSPPLSTARRHELETPRDYGKESIAMLRYLARDRHLRGFETTAPKSDLIWRLEADDETQKKLLEQWQERATVYNKNRNFPDVLLERYYCQHWYGEQEAFNKELAARADKVLTSPYKADACRKSFMDLPGEVRNMIYGYVLFGGTPSERWEISTQGPRLVCYRPSGSDYSRSCRRFGIAFRTSLYGILCAINTQVRHEARCFFWKHLNFRLSNSCRLDEFLDNIGSEGRGSVQKMQRNAGKRGLKRDEGATAAFLGELRLFRTCVGLRTLVLDLNTSMLFRTEVECLRDFFATDEPLSSYFLEHLAIDLIALPKLENVFLKMESCVKRDIGCPCCGFWYYEPDDFLRFAFSGQRQNLLWREIQTRLQARYTKWEDTDHELSDSKDSSVRERSLNGDESASSKLGGKILVRIHYPDWRGEDHIKHARILDYEAWLRTATGRAKTMSQCMQVVRAVESGEIREDVMQDNNGDDNEGDP